MQSTSSVPPPHERIPPFPAREENAGCCYISGEPIDPKDPVVMIPVDGGKHRCPAKLSALFEALEIYSEAEQQVFRQSFIAAGLNRKPELLWFKFSRHNTALFHLLLAKLSTF